MTFADLPAVNAGLNAASALLLTAGFIFIRQQQRVAHRNCMIAALICSTLFLTSYITYHLHASRTVFKDRELEWGKHDSLALPNWTWHRHINRSKREPAILFTMSDTPILSAFGFYREETEDREALAPAAPAGRLSAAE